MVNDNAQKTAKDLYLDDLDNQIAKLVALRAIVESGGDMTAAGSAAVGPLARRSGVETQVRPDSFHRMSTPAAVRRFLEMMGKGNPQTPQAIADALVRGALDIPENQSTVLRNVYTALTRGLDKENGFGKVGKFWGLYEWYPTATPAASSTGKKGRKKKGKKRTAKASHASTLSRTAEQPHAKLTYQEFVKAHAKPGKPMKDIGAEWSRYKAANA